jgi:Tol biopolymer transport system component
MYFLNKDGAGLLQIFRLDADGRRLHQITFEPANVDTYDVSPKDGGVAYASNNQLFLEDASGAGRRLLLDAGPVDESNRWTNSVGMPVWSPDGQTLAYGHGGLNFLTLATGATTRVLENQVDTSAGFPVVGKIYTPNTYSPDGSRLLISIAFYEGGSFGIYSLSDESLIQLERSDGGTICCHVSWIPDGTGLYIASPSLGMIESGLFYADSSNGTVTALLPGAPPDGTYNFADAAQVGPDGQLYFFFSNLPAIPAPGHTPLSLVRSASDGATGRRQLLPDPFQNINEILWARDTSLAMLVLGPDSDTYAGGRLEIAYPDGRPGVVLLPSARDLRWGP